MTMSCALQIGDHGHQLSQTFPAPKFFEVVFQKRQRGKCTLRFCDIWESSLSQSERSEGKTCLFWKCLKSQPSLKCHGKSKVISGLPLEGTDPQGLRSTEQKQETEKQKQKKKKKKKRKYPVKVHNGYISGLSLVVKPQMPPQNGLPTLNNNNNKNPTHLLGDSWLVLLHFWSTYCRLVGLNQLT